MAMHETEAICRSISSARKNALEGHFIDAITDYNNALSMCWDLPAEKATIEYWKTACEIICHDFSDRDDFRALLKAYTDIVSTSEDDRVTHSLGATVAFCEGWLYFLGDKHVNRETVVIHRGATETSRTPLELSGHIICELALCKVNGQAGLDTIETTARQSFIAFVACVKSKTELPWLCKDLRECLISTVSTLENAMHDGGAAQSNQVVLRRVEDVGDSIGTLLAVHQCHKISRVAGKLIEPLRKRQIATALFFYCVGLALSITALRRIVSNNDTVRDILTLVALLAGVTMSKKILVASVRQLLFLDFALLAACILLYLKQ